MKDITSKLFFNIGSAFAEKSMTMIFQFISSFLIIRFLSKEDYGILGITAGYHALISFLNISPEGIILKEYNRIERKINRYISIYFFVNIIKACTFLLFYLLIGGVLSFLYELNNFFYASCYLGILSLLDMCTSTFQITLVVQFRQSIVTYIRVVNAVLTLILTIPFFYFPTIQFLVLRSLVVFLVMTFVWIYVARYFINFDFGIPSKNNIWKVVKRSLISYSFWTHLNSVSTNFIYRMDTIVLSFFLPISVIGNYSVVLNILNYFGDFFSQVVNYQSSIAIARTSYKQGLNLLGFFTRSLVLISIILCVLSVVLGRFFLTILLGDEMSNVQEAYSYLLPILVGLLLTRFIFSPLASWVFLKESIVHYTFFVTVPLLTMSFPVYFIGGYIAGGIGVAWGNVVLGVITSFLILCQAKTYMIRVNFNPLHLMKDFKSLGLAYNNKKMAA